MSLFLHVPSIINIKVRCGIKILNENKCPFLNLTPLPSFFIPYNLPLLSSILQIFSFSKCSNASSTLSTIVKKEFNLVVTINSSNNLLREHITTSPSNFRTLVNTFRKKFSPVLLIYSSSLMSKMMR